MTDLSSINNKIDFVITWVDGKDPKWLNEKNKYEKSFLQSQDGNSQSDHRIDSSNLRFRNDFDFLKYWFRGVENFAPWVNRVFFVTSGHLPKWLNLTHPKLKIIRHRDFIPKKYLPTFNSHTIENNLHRIKELSENFVYFNDDFYLLKKTKPTDFFIKISRKHIRRSQEYVQSYQKCIQKDPQKDIQKDPQEIHVPRAFFVENLLINNPSHDIYPYILMNNMAIINQHFNKRSFLKQQFRKVFNPRYGSNILRTILLLPWRDFSLIYDPHAPIAYQKATFKKVWQKERKQLDDTCLHKFRTDRDVSHLVFYYFQLLEGNFCPRSARFSHHTMLSQNEKQNQKIIRIVKSQKYHLLAINDGLVKNPAKTKKALESAFFSILPNKSQFEK